MLYVAEGLPIIYPLCQGHSASVTGKYCFSSFCRKQFALLTLRAELSPPLSVKDKAAGQAVKNGPSAVCTVFRGQLAIASLEL